MKKVTWFFPLHAAPFYGQDYEKQKRSGTSYQSLWVSKHVYKNLFFGLVLLIWKLERKGEKIIKHWISQEQKELFRGNKLLIKYRK